MNSFAAQIFAALVSGGLLTGLIALLMLPKQMRKLGAETDVLLSKEAREWVIQARAEVAAALERASEAERRAGEAERTAEDCRHRCARMEQMLRDRGIPVPPWPPVRQQSRRSR